MKRNDARERSRGLKIKIYTDGAARGNPGPGSWGFIIEKGNGEYIGSGLLGKVTNNVAEYSAAINGLSKALALATEGDVIELFSDSQLLINQLSGRWRVKDAKLKKLKIRIDELMSELTEKGIMVELKRVSRENAGIKRTDALCNSALDSI